MVLIFNLLSIRCLKKKKLSIFQFNVDIHERKIKYDIYLFTFVFTSFLYTTSWPDTYYLFI